MLFKRKSSWLAAIAAAGSLISLYIWIRNRRRTSGLMLHTGELGTVNVTTAALEQMVDQLLSEERNVQPLCTHVAFEGQQLLKVTGTLQLKKGRFTPSLEELEEKVRTKLADWIGFKSPVVAIHFETKHK